MLAKHLYQPLQDSHDVFFHHLCQLVDNSPRQSHSDIRSSNQQPRQLDNIHVTMQPDSPVQESVDSVVDSILSNVLSELALKKVDTVESSAEEKRVTVKEEVKVNCRTNKNVKKETLPFRKPRKLDGSEIIIAVAKQVIVDGAAVFFPDKEARRRQLFNMMGIVEVKDNT